MSKVDKANSQAPSLRPNNPFANSSNDNTTNNQGIASSDSQLEELRKRVDESAYANTAYDRANAFSVTNTREQPNIGIGGSATAYGGVKDADLSFTSVATDEPVMEPEPAPVPEPEPLPMPTPAPAPAPAPVPEPMPEPEPPKPQFVQTVQSPAPQPTFQSTQPVKEKSGLSLPLIIVIILVALGLVALAIWGIMSLRKRDQEVNPVPTPEPAPVVDKTISYEEYNRRIEAKEAINCTATYNSSKYLGTDYASGQYEIFSEKSWTVAADEGWNHVYVSNYDFRFNLADDSALASYDLQNSPASIYFDNQDAYLWSITLTPRAGGDGTATYRLASYETVAPSLKLTRSDVEGSMISDFYETVKVSADEFNDSETGSITFTCEDDGITSYQEFIDARKAQIGAGDAQ